MQATQKRDMLLFNKEITPYPRKYVLYFVDMRTFYDPKPRIHRFLCPWRKFSAFTLGMAYNLSVADIVLRDAQETQAYDIPEEDYQALLEAKTLRFIPLNEARRRQKRNEDIFNAQDHYSFADVKEMLAYSDTLLMRAWLWLIHAAMQAAAFLLPSLAYLLILYRGISGLSDVRYALRIPLLALAALPLMIYVMFILAAFAEMLQLRWPYTRWALLRRRVLLSGGQRQSLRFSQENRQKLLLWGGVAFGILLLMWLILLIAGMMR